MVATPMLRLSRADYLVREDAAQTKSEHINGEVYAMAGGTLEHSALAPALAAELRTALAGKPCRIYSSDVRVHVASTGATFYPDLSVVCGQATSPPDDPHALANPRVLVEVLSDSSEAYDRGAKASHYRRLDSLQEYVLVSQGEPRIEVQRRSERGIWELYFFGPGEALRLESLGVSVPVDAVYANPLAAG
jgi:Uma2 family endonuclease